MKRDFKLPSTVSNLLSARDAVKKHFNKKIYELGSAEHLRFTLDGNLVGDLGEAMAVELFAIQLVSSKSNLGIDGYLINGRSVQVKATGTKRGPAFRNIGFHADFLLFFEFDWDLGLGTVVFNGPEHYARARLPDKFDGQRSLTSKQIRLADMDVKDHERLVRI